MRRPFGGGTAALLLAAALGACAASSNADPQDAGAAPAQPQHVAVAPVLSRRIHATAKVPAEIYGWYWISIFSRVPAYADKVLVDRASVVRAGQLLAVLSAPDLVARRTQAEATMIGDRATFLRLRRAARTPGAVAKNELDLARAREQADTQLVDALRTLEGYLRVEAPFDGVIVERNVHPGTIVGPASGPESLPLFRLQQISRLRVTADVPEEYVGVMQLGAEVPFTVDAWPGRTFTGTVRRPAGALDVRTRTMPVELDFDNAKGALAPGMYAELRWPVARPGPSLLVPASAVVTTPEALFVLRVADGHVERVPVRRGLSDGGLVEVFGALAPGDLVAAPGDADLAPGTEVVPHPAPASPTAAR